MWEDPLEIDHLTDATVHETTRGTSQTAGGSGGSEKLLLSKHVSVSCRLQLVLFQLSQPLGAQTRLTKLENMVFVSKNALSWLLDQLLFWKPRYIHIVLV